MQNAFKQFGVKGTGWFKNQFQSSVWKLTIFYTAILALILFISSSFIYGAFSKRLENRFKSNRTITVRTVWTAPPPPTAEQVRADLIRSILIVNGLLLGCAALLGYCLAYITVKPLQEMNEKQKRFFGDASHELRTPLSILQIDLENQLANNTITTQQHQQLTSHLEEVTRMSTLVNNLLTLSRFDEYSPDQEKNFTSINIIALINSLVTPLQTLAKHHAVELKFTNPSQTEINIFSNTTILSQALTNIIKNSIVYNKPNGTVEITAAQNKNKTIITVVDTGIGMTAEEIQKVFDRFYRANKSRSSQISGSGLGLSIAHSSLQYLGGTIDITSTPGKGTTTTLTLS